MHYTHHLLQFFNQWCKLAFNDGFTHSQTSTTFIQLCQTVVHEKIEQSRRRPTLREMLKYSVHAPCEWWMMMMKNENLRFIRMAQTLWAIRKAKLLLLFYCMYALCYLYSGQDSNVYLTDRFRYVTRPVSLILVWH